MTILFFILKILGIVVSIAIVILCLVLFVPFRYMISGNINEEVLSLDAYVKWLFGAVKGTVSFENGEIEYRLTILRIHFDISNIVNKNTLTKREKKTEKDSKSNKDKAKKKKQHLSLNNLFDTVTSNYKKFKDIINIIKPKYFNVHGFYGFEDLSLTGQITAIICVFIHSENVNLVPVFDREIIDVQAEIRGDIKVSLIASRFIKYFFKKKFKKLSIKVKHFNTKKCID